ncbi:MAG: hypothetical protein ABII10_00875 [Candidatus Paceibacterota bacterium]
MSDQEKMFSVKGNGELHCFEHQGVAYIFTNEEIEELEALIDNPAIPFIATALGFLLREGRLTGGKPTIAEISKVFSIRVEQRGSSTSFADPLETRSSRIRVDSGFIIPNDKISQLGGGNYHVGITKMTRYLESIYKEHGTIANAMVAETPKKTPESAARFEALKKQGEISAERAEMQRQIEFKTTQEKMVDGLIAEASAHSKKR